MLLWESAARAQEPVPCLIFSGYGTDEQCLDLAKFNRIYFDHSNMTVASSTDNETESFYIPYTDYHHFKIGLAVPKTISAIEDIVIAGDVQLVFDGKTGALRLRASSSLPFAIGIYNLSGNLIASSVMCNGESLSTEGLSPGVYIATATDQNDKTALKFIIK